MTNGKTSTARRREVRRNVPRQEPLWVQHARRREVYWGSLYVFVFALLGGLIISHARQDPSYRLGQFVERPIVSRVDFTAIDQAASAEERRRAAERVPAVFSLNEGYLDTLRSRFADLLALAEREYEQIDPSTREQLALTPTAFETLRQYARSPERVEEWKARSQAVIQGLFHEAILEPKELTEVSLDASPLGPEPVYLEHPAPGEGFEPRKYPGAITAVTDRSQLQTLVDLIAVPFPEVLRPTIEALLLSEIRPTYRYDPQLTMDRRARAAAQVPVVQRPYSADTVLIPSGTRLDSTQLDLLAQERDAFHRQRSTADRSLSLLGLFGIALLVGLGLWVYIFSYNDKVVRNPVRGAALTALIIAMQATAVFATRAWPEFFYVTGTFPTLMTAVVLAIVYDQRFALALGVLHALLVMVSLNLSVGYGVALAVGLGVAVGQLHEVRTRSTLVRVGWWTGVAMGLAVLIVGLGTRPLRLEGGLERILLDAAGACVSGIGVGIVVQGVLPFVERMFRVTTAMTLKELNDASHPLLRRLAEEAPGTFQHSLRIADMAEAAAEAIGGDGLLCRVGAMYHDVGKINKPQYFIENQGGGPNRHNKLSPAMSLLIIVGHVKDGVEMAREFGLPSVLRHFIESHHGTTLVEYFYHAARKQKEAEDKPGPSEFEFRYPGPKPQSKEAAILLLCDSLEAAARALPEPTPVRLEQLVHNIATKRLMDGQFDECALTLSELHRIEQAITKTLCAIYHARIKYPTEKKPQDAGEKPPVSEATGTPQTATA